ncbi:hypothetical protein V8E55_009763 [Tylopilus felleus]
MRMYGVVLIFLAGLWDTMLSRHLGLSSSRLNCGSVHGDHQYDRHFLYTWLCHGPFLSGSELAQLPTRTQGLVFRCIFLGSDRYSDTNTIDLLSGNLST